MKAKPEGAQYRNLFLDERRGSIIYWRQHAGEVYTRRLDTLKWSVAAARRDAIEDELALPRRRTATPIPPPARTFGSWADDYLRDGLGERAATTRYDHGRLLRAEGAAGALRDLPLAEIDAVALAGLLKPAWSPSTVNNVLSAVARVFTYAEARGYAGANPTPALRRRLADARRGTKAARAAAAPKANPIERPEELARLLAEAAAESREAGVFVLLLLDAGLRFGEARAVAWGDVAWGSDDRDTSRALLIRRNLPRGALEPEPTKSGRERRVALSKRLRGALREHYRDRFQPGPEAPLFPELDADTFRKREWRRILERAGIGDRDPKDLRDTYASQLLTCGVPLAYISAQLGHGDAAVTAKHYARWTGGAEYRDPMLRRPGEVPADFLARLPGAKALTKALTGRRGETARRASVR